MEEFPVKEKDFSIDAGSIYEMLCDKLNVFMTPRIGEFRR